MNHPGDGAERWVRWVSLALLCGLMQASWASAAEPIRVAVASNFAGTLRDLATDFEARRGVRLSISSGSTGKLYAQIRNGAPYDVFLAADRDRPRRLLAEGWGSPAWTFVYARGRMVLWCPGRRCRSGGAALLRRLGRLRLAIANPRTAPYGRAARDVLERLGLWPPPPGALVVGESVQQAYQFAHAGAVDLAFVAAAQLTDRARRDAETLWWIPADLHGPLDQQALLLRDRPAARAFLTYLRGDAAGRILRRAGYDLP